MRNWARIRIRERDILLSDDGVLIGLPVEVLVFNTTACFKRARVLKTYAKDNGYIHYVVRGKCGTVHRLVAETFIGPIPMGMDVDHINHNRMDNRVENLRIVTRAQNLLNRSGANKNSKSGVLGVHWHKKQKAWIARGTDGTDIGAFKDLEEATKVANAARASGVSVDRRRKCYVCGEDFTQKGTQSRRFCRKNACVVEHRKRHAVLMHDKLLESRVNV